MSDEYPDEMAQLQAHNELVRQWGGRLNSPARSTLQELSNTSLGSTKTVPTNGITPISPEPITLAEMVVSQPLSVDVSFAYPNIIIRNLVDPLVPFAPNNPLSVGDGYVRVRWGTKGQITHVARIDGNLGWRFPFVASHLIVDYVPVDVQSTGGRVIPLGQPRALEIAAMISPASGAVAKPLTKTLFFPDVPVGGFELQQNPLWGSSFRPASALNRLTTWSITLFDGAFNLVQQSDADGIAGTFPSFAIRSFWTPVPPDATLCNLGVDVASPVGLIQPKVIFQLAL